jgi:hypothetical protein
MVHVSEVIGFKRIQNQTAGNEILFHFQREAAEQPFL